MPGLNKPSHHKHAQRKWKQTRWLITIFIIPFICYRQVTILRKLGSFGDYGFDVTHPSRRYTTQITAKKTPFTKQFSQITNARKHFVEEINNRQDKQKKMFCVKN